MERTIYDIMTNDPMKIQKFKSACDEMLGSSYILAEGRISAILKCIATSKTLYGLFTRILDKFDYKETAKACKTFDIANDSSRARIKLPDTQEEIAAFVFCVLLDLDKHNIELKDFLPFFGDDDSSSAFKVFLKEFVAPFKNAVIGILENERAADEQKKHIENSENERKKIELDFDRFMGTFVARINSDDTIGTILKDDLTVLCGNFSNAVHNDDIKQSRVLYAKLTKKLRIHKPALARELEKFDIDKI